MHFLGIICSLLSPVLNLGRDDCVSVTNTLTTPHMFWTCTGLAGFLAKINRNDCGSISTYTQNIEGLKGIFVRNDFHFQIYT